MNVNLKKITICLSNIILLFLIIILGVLLYLVPYFFRYLLKININYYESIVSLSFDILFYIPFIIYFIIRKNEIKNENIISLIPVSKNLSILLKYFIIAFIVLFMPFLIFKIFNLINIKFVIPSSNKLIKQKLIYIFFQFIYFSFVGFVEELLFRGLILNRFLKVFKLLSSILISSLIFSFYHFIILQYIFTDANIKLYFKNSIIQNIIFTYILIYIISLIMSIIKVKTKSIYASIGYHFGYDFFVAILFNNYLANTTLNSIIWIPIFRFILHFNYPDHIYILKFQINTMPFAVLIIFLSQILYLIFIIIEFMFKNRKKLIISK